MLDTVRPPLVRNHVSKSCLPLIEQLVDNAVLGTLLEILKRMLQGRSLNKLWKTNWIFVST
jgi:hypothetical protein